MADGANGYPAICDAMVGPPRSPLLIECQRRDGAYADGVPEVGDLPRLVADLDGGALALNAGAVELIVGGEAPRYIVTYMELVDDQSRDLREAWDLVGDASASGEVEVTFGGQAADVPKRLVVGVDEAVSACIEFAETRRRPRGNWVADSGDWPGK